MISPVDDVKARGEDDCDPQPGHPIWKVSEDQESGGGGADDLEILEWREETGFSVAKGLGDQDIARSGGEAASRAEGPVPSRKGARVRG